MMKNHCSWQSWCGWRSRPSKHSWQKSQKSHLLHCWSSLKALTGYSVNTLTLHKGCSRYKNYEQTSVNKEFIHSEPSSALKWKTVWYYWQQRVSGNCSSIYKWFARDSRDDLGKAAKDFNAAKDDGVAVALAGPYAYRLHDMIGCIHGGILPQTSHAEQSENEDQAIAKPRCLLSHGWHRCKSLCNSSVAVCAKSQAVAVSVPGTCQDFGKQQGEISHKRAICKAFAIPQNYRDITYEKLVLGQLPTRLVVGLINNAAFNRSRNHKPFNFRHYNLLIISIDLDGQQQHTWKPIHPKYDMSQFVFAYKTLFSRTCKLNHDKGNHISCNDFDKGYALYALTWWSARQMILLIWWNRKTFVCRCIYRSRCCCCYCYCYC